MTASHVLAIDLGTSGAKVGLVNELAEVVDHDFEATRLLLFPGGGAEQDPGEWWSAITRASQRLMKRTAVEPRDVAAVSVTAQWVGTVAVDVAGEAIGNAIIWMDSRGAAHIRRALSGPVRVHGYDVLKLISFIRKTGGAPSHSGKDPLAHILYLKNERPDVYAAAGKFLEPADYLNLRLCGSAVSSHDCIVGHWLTDNRTRDRIRYDERLIAIAGVDSDKLPDLVPSASVVGALSSAVAGELGLVGGTKVVTASGDIHSAVLGSGALADYAGHLYIGTSSWLSCHVPWKRTDIAHNQAAIPSALPGRYFIANEHETAGECLDFLRDNIFFPDDELNRSGSDFDVYSAFESVAQQSPPGAHDLLFTPWLNGERTPVEDPTIRASFHNMSLRTTRADMVRSVYEGVAYNSRWLLDAVEGFVKHPLDGLNFIGGGARSDLWCQIHADVLQRPIHKMEQPQQANLRGAAFVGFIALGVASAEDLAARVRIAETFEPRPGVAAGYDRFFKEFKQLYKLHKNSCARLNSEVMVRT